MDKIWIDIIDHKLEHRLKNEYGNLERYKQIMKSIKKELEGMIPAKFDNFEELFEKLPALELRAPVFWHQQRTIAEHFLQHNLFVTKKLLKDVQDLWFDKYETTKIVVIHDLGPLPLTSLDMIKNWKTQCERAQNYIEKTWFLDVANIFKNHEKIGSNLRECKLYYSQKMNRKLIASVNAMLSIQLRKIVVNTLKHILEFLESFEGGNSFDVEYSDTLFNRVPFFSVDLASTTEQNRLRCSPHVFELQSLILYSLDQIIDVAKNVPKIEKTLFPNMRHWSTLLGISREDYEVSKIVNEILSCISAHLMGPYIYMRIYDMFENVYDASKNYETDFDFSMNNKQFLKEISREVQKYDDLQEVLMECRNKAMLNMIQLNCTKFNSEVSEKIQKQRSRLCSVVTKELQKNNIDLCATFEEVAARVSMMPETTQEVVDSFNYLCESRDITMYLLKNRIDRSAELLLFIFDHFPPDDEAIKLTSRTILWPKEIENVMNLAYNRLTSKKEHYEQILKNRREAFDQRISEAQKSLEHLRKKDSPLLSNSEIESTVKEVEKLRETMVEINAEASGINEEENLLDLDLTSFSNLVPMTAMTDALCLLWKTLFNFHSNYEKWMYGSFREIDFEEVNRVTLHAWKTLKQLFKSLPDSAGGRRAAEIVKNNVEKIKECLPLLRVICNRDLRDRHWEVISGIVGLEAIRLQSCSLAEVLSQEMASCLEDLEGISSSATKEGALEKNLKNMHGEWEDICFEVQRHRGTGVNLLCRVDDLQILLDDHILKVQTMRSSPYVKAFETEIQSWEEKLILVQDITDQWMTCQNSWIESEPIFKSEDIARQMQKESKIFEKINRIWKSLTAHLTNATRVIEITKIPDLSQQLKHCNEQLGEIKKNVNNYLQNKRLLFARLYFLSSEELMQIYSNTKNLRKIQAHLPKLFKGIKKLKLTKDNEITHIVSEEGEKVSLSNKISIADAKFVVEKWLFQLDEQMKISLRDIAQESLENFSNTLYENWIMTWPGQIVVCASQIQWTCEVVQAIKNEEMGNCLEKCNSRIGKIVDLLRGKLEVKNRVTLKNLVIVNIHSRDTVAQLMENGAKDEMDFLWLSQMRFYWLKGTIVLSMVTTMVDYGFEYLGNVSRIVVTPQTERCHRVLINSLKLNCFGALQGPEGSGKTETIKDLCKIVAKQCIFFGFSKNIHREVVTTLLKGIVQCGAWSCFKDFDKNNSITLSSTAQQIKTIQNAIEKNLEKFILDGTEMKFNPTCAIFITINPENFHRTELPSNLKSSFRTMSMMTPNYTTIIEVSLMTFGFLSAKLLAKKVEKLNKLSLEQMNFQCCDYDQKNMKSFLEKVENLKTENEILDENSIVLTAIISVFLPKLSDHDAKIFQDICGEIFLFEKVEENRYVRLRKLLEKTMLEENYFVSSSILDKILNIYEILELKTGVIVVGESFQGKTVACKMLVKALENLDENDSKAPKVWYRIINPKSVTIENLYGKYGETKKKYLDGIFTKTLREFINLNIYEKKWIIMDGPMDMTWTEFLSTMFDGNKKLCLAAGEILHIPKNINIIFETTNISRVSPGFLNKCGIVFIDSSNMLWTMLFEQLKNNFKHFLGEEQFKILVDVLQWLIVPLLEFVGNFCTRLFVAKDVLMFSWFSKILLTTLEPESAISTVSLQCTLLFSLVWGLGSTLDSAGRTAFDIYFRELLNGGVEEHPRPKAFKLTKQQMFPDISSVFKWVYNKKDSGSWIAWTDSSIPQLPPKLETSIVPTLETSTQHYFITKLLKPSQSIVFVGPTGSGKSTTIKNYLLESSKNKTTFNVINFSAHSQSSQTQDLILKKLDRRRKGVYGPSMGKSHVVFVDDLSVPEKDDNGSQPTLELLRQWIEHQYFFDPKSGTVLNVVDTSLISAILPPSEPVSPRLMRHAYVFAVDATEYATSLKIYTTIINKHFEKDLSPDKCNLNKFIAKSTIDLYMNVRSAFPKSPEKVHYVFSLKDVSKVVSGVLFVPISRVKDVDKLTRLWAHETFRVFHDRLVNDEDRKKFSEIFAQVCRENYQQAVDTNLEDSVFCSFMEKNSRLRIYDEIRDTESIRQKIELFLEEYNSSAEKQLNIAVFEGMIQHVVHMARVLFQNNGPSLLIGPKTSGKKTCARIGVKMCDFDIFELKKSLFYGKEQWETDFVDLVSNLQINEKPTVVLINDNHIKNVSFLEDVNIILSRIDVFNQVEDTSQESDNKPGKSVISCEGFFHKVKNKLRFIFTMTPTDDWCRRALEKFPFFIKTCNIDYYLVWPKEALQQITTSYLSPVNIDSDTRNKCVKTYEGLHKAAQTYFNRKYHEPSVNFLDYLRYFRKFYAFKREQITQKRCRYIQGLEKLDNAAEQVVLMQKELQELKPKLLVQSQLSDKLMIKIEQDTVNVEAKKEVVAADEALANEAAAAAQAIKDDCESDLAEATPAVESALLALDTLKSNDITIVKAMKNPPPGVRLVMESVCVLKGIKPGTMQDPITGETVDDYWPASIKLLGDIKFLENLKTFEKDDIPASNIKKIREKYINDRGFKPENIKKISAACEGLCKWVRAIEIYDKVVKVVAPKKALLAKAEAELTSQMETLNEKRSLLQEVTDKLQQLNDELAESMREKKKLEDQIDFCMQKMDKAEKLLVGLSSEKGKWNLTLEELRRNLDNMVGDVLIVSAIVAFTGELGPDDRGNLVEKWKKICEELKICYSENFELTDVLGDPIEIATWKEKSLPMDNHFMENAIIAKFGNKCPILIDPQNQANDWIKNLEKSNNLTVLRFDDFDFTTKIEKALFLGFSILVENISEITKVIFDLIVQINDNNCEGKFRLKIRENEIEIGSDFRLYLITSSLNPRLSPEICEEVILIDFEITETNLNEKLLEIIVNEDFPALEEKKNAIITDDTKNFRVLKETEEKILKILTTSKGNILEDETTIKILTCSKVICDNIKSKQKNFLEALEKIKNFRRKYEFVSFYATNLFYCILKLKNISNMYQYSLTWFLDLYNKAIKISTKIDNSYCLDNVIKNLTTIVYENVGRSLFSEDKLVFQFLMTLNILESKGQIDRKSLDLFSLDVSGRKNIEEKNISWLPEKSWEYMAEIFSIDGIPELKSSLFDREEQWKNFFLSNDRSKCSFPEPFSKEINTLKGLVLMRCFRPDEIKKSIEKFIIYHTDLQPNETKNPGVQESYNESKNSTPLIFIHMNNSNPINRIMEFATKINFPKEKIAPHSYGCHENSMIESSIKNLMENGDWLIIQNCHLSTSWIQKLIYVLMDFAIENKMHTDFRLWLVTLPSDQFPVSVLQNGIKMTHLFDEALESLNNYYQENDDFTSMTKKSRRNDSGSVWEKIFFSLCLFHAIVEGRRFHGSFGWKIPYEFGISSLIDTIWQIKTYHDTFDSASLGTFANLIIACNYGRLISDEADRVLMNHLVASHINSYATSDNKNPQLYDEFRDSHQILPLSLNHEQLGLDVNAEIEKNYRESEKFLDAFRKLRGFENEPLKHKRGDES